MVVTEGETDLEVRFVTEPMPLSIDKEVAPETVQDRVEDWPEVMEEGEAVKEEMAGALAAAVVVNVLSEETTKLVLASLLLTR